MRAATTRAQIHGAQPQVLMNQMRPKSLLRLIENPCWSLRNLSLGVRLGKSPPQRASDGSGQDSPGDGPTPFDHLLDIPLHQPSRRGNEDDETIPGVLDAIDEAEATPERRTTLLPLAQRLDLKAAC